MTTFLISVATEVAKNLVAINQRTLGPNGSRNMETAKEMGRSVTRTKPNGEPTGRLLVSAD